MGLSPYERNGRCETCGQEEKECPGHMGHIELVMPVYNCFLMTYLHKVLRIKCFFCHKIKFTSQKLADYKILFSLIKLGLYEEFEKYKELSQSRIHLRVINQKKAEKTQHKENSKQRKASKSESTRRSSGDLSETEDVLKSSETNSALLTKLYQEISNNIKNEKATIKDLLNVKKNKDYFKNGITSTFSTSQCFSQILKEFLRDAAATSKCPHCDNTQPSVKKEGFAKFILYNLNDNTKMSKVLHAAPMNNHRGSGEDEELDLVEGDLNEEEDDEQKKKSSKKSKIMHPFEVREQVRLLFENNQTLMNLMFGNVVCNPVTLERSKKGFEIITFSPDSFFLDALPVSPNRFRPENKLSDSTFLHAHTTILQKILTINYELKKMMADTKKKANNLKDNFSKWIELQETVNSLFDSSKTGKVNADSEVCIKQLLEKKEGIFRMKIMGKRVNYAARSVISPDPNLNTNEVGVPLFMAKKLTFPEGVNEANYEKLKKLIINGPAKWPGAMSIHENGKVISLEGSTSSQREALARSLLENAENKTVYRHLMNGDVLLFNRQPTLHKPSLMSHIARVLPSEQTIRMHYANCSGYNADFDGDEMNLHFLQSHVARAEAYNLSICDKQYILPTNRGPIRGLIQDIILSSVFLTMQGTFFEKSEYNQLIYSSMRTLIESESEIRRLKLLPPAIMRPRKLWTGKQVVSTLISIIADRNEVDKEKAARAHQAILNESLYMSGKSRINESHLSKINRWDQKVIVQGNELLTGIIDKNSIGATPFGLVHCFYELTDSDRTGRLMSGLGRLFCGFLQMHGFTCGLDDLLTTPGFEIDRKRLLDEVYKKGMDSLAENLGVESVKYKSSFDFFGRPSYAESPSDRLKKILKRKPGKNYLHPNNELSLEIGRKIAQDDIGLVEIDGFVKGQITSEYNRINELAMSEGLSKKFPSNCFSVMVLSGAKGSTVNHNQISCMLGQQSLEGQRVPIMASGKTLPSFAPYDPNVRAGGFIADRFLTGLRPQEFYFHCMAGREGLVDTAVKTSRSGYLQRILVKNLESLIVQYDYSVRHNDGTVVQFLYGEDGLDSVKVGAIEKINFMADNLDSFSISSNTLLIKKSLDSKSSKKWYKSQRKNPSQYNNRSIMNELSPSLNFGSISEKAYSRMQEFLANDPRFKGSKKESKRFRELFYSKYFASLACPGEAVGAIAAQSFGEPSTQMTLNTFHLAGHGGANVTLGIPRLRELLVTRGTKTPSMNLYFKEKLTKLKAKEYSRKLSKVSLLELIKEIEVSEKKNLVDVDGVPLPPSERFRVYKVKFQFEDIKAIKFAFGFGSKKIQRFLNKVFKQKLLKSLSKIIQKKSSQKGTKLLNNDKENGLDYANYDLENIRYKKSAEGVHKNADDSSLPDQSEYEDDENDDDEEIEDENVEKGGRGKSKKEVNTAEEENGDSNNPLIEVPKVLFTSQELKLESDTCTFSIKYPLDVEKFLMVNIVEDICKISTIREVPGIKACHVLTTSNGENYLQTEGVNFPASWNMDCVNPTKIECNDTHAISEAYGIEAARGALVREITAVFSPYGITVDHRHLYLVTDYMTNNGYVNPMSRAGMQHNTSPLIKMSFETTMKFLTEACLFNQFDKLDTPSGRLVLGRPVQNGTGLFDVRQDLSTYF